MKKKVLFAITALLCALTCAFSLTACGDKPVEIGFVYKLSDDGASYAITGLTYNGSDLYQASKYLKGMPEEITVPAEYDGKPVTVIENMGDGKGVKKVVLPDGIVKIGGFSTYEDLESINIGDNVKEISENAFSGLTNLELEIGENSKLEKVGKAAFSGTKIKSFKAPATLKFKKTGNNTYDSDSLFESCAELETVDLSAMTAYVEEGYVAGTIYIGKSFATGCSKLETVIIPDERFNFDSKSFSDNSSTKTTVYMHADPLDGASKLFFNGTPESTSCVSLSKICFYSETDPGDTTTNFWRYVDGTPAKW